MAEGVIPGQNEPHQPRVARRGFNDASITCGDAKKQGQKTTRSIRCTQGLQRTDREDGSLREHVIRRTKKVNCPFRLAPQHTIKFQLPQKITPCRANNLNCAFSSGATSRNTGNSRIRLCRAVRIVAASAHLRRAPSSLERTHPS